VVSRQVPFTGIPTAGAQPAPPGAELLGRRSSMHSPTDPPRAVVHELFHRQQEEQLREMEHRFPTPEDFQEALADARHAREVFLDSRANLNLDSALARA